MNFTTIKTYWEGRLRGEGFGGNSMATRTSTLLVITMSHQPPKWLELPGAVAHIACGWARKSTYNRLKLRPLCGEQYLAAFGIEDQYRGPVRAEGNARAASIMLLETIQKVWPSFPPIYEKWKEDDEEEEEGGRRYLAGLYDSCNRIFRDKTQHTNTDTKTKSDERCVSMEEQERKLAKIQDLLSNYTKAKLSSHKFDEDFPTLVHNFIRANAELFTPTMPGTVPLLLTAHGYQPWKLCHVSRVDLSRFPGLPADTVVELVTPKHLASILDMTRLDELRFWDNPGLAGAVWDRRIAKLTSRERFLEPLQRLAAWVDDWRSRRGTPRIQPPPPMAPTPARIRQLVWTTLKTTETDKPSTAVGDWMQLPPPGRVSLAQLDADKLAWILHPSFRDWVKGAGEETHVFAETIAFPLHDVRAPRDEVYTSVARFEKSMTTKAIIRFGHDAVLNRWPLKLPLEMATGCERDRYAITSPFPVELFALAWDDGSPNDHPWYDIVNDYSGLALSFEKDKLPALAAISQGSAKERENDDRFLAGLWKNSLLYDMLWEAYPQNSASGPTQKPVISNAPSWSWASVTSPVKWFMFKNYMSPHYQLDCTKLETIEVKPIGPLYLGRYSQCELIFRGPLIATTSEDLEVSIFMKDAGKENKGFRIDGVMAVHQFTPDYAFDLNGPVYGPATSPKFILPLMIQHGGHHLVVGIVLRPIEHNASTYERVGLVILVYVKRGPPMDFRPETSQEWDYHHGG
ncbi:hypothetical protein NUW58_g3302 [Xylaria curta]|uniref:Uncharacterized protein n=1 Tax=Xylaria curta TaxID=42375 RepID=A0ACC1PD49_9PEZI|nr:hypothetical protein NUW58_g3302 [Xylaria curta]